MRVIVFLFCILVVNAQDTISFTKQPRRSTPDIFEAAEPSTETLGFSHSNTWDPKPKSFRPSTPVVVTPVESETVTLTPTPKPTEVPELPKESSESFFGVVTRTPFGFFLVGVEDEPDPVALKPSKVNSVNLQELVGKSVKIEGTLQYKIDITSIRQAE